MQKLNRILLINIHFFDNIFVDIGIYNHFYNGQSPISDGNFTIKFIQHNIHIIYIFFTFICCI